MIVIEAGFTGVAEPLTQPRLAAFPVAGTAVVSSEVTGFEGLNAKDMPTYTFWRPSSVPATWELDFAAAADVSYIGLAAHDCGTVGATVQAQRWSGSAWVTMATHLPSDNSPILFLLALRNLDRIRLRFTGAVPTVGVIWAGAVTELPRKARFVGGVPFDEATQSTFADTISDGGHVIDRFETRRAQPCSMQVEHLPEAWCAANIPALRAHMAIRPIFMADRPQDYPKSVVFGMVPEPLRAERAMANLAATRSMAIDVTGFATV
jgi:hypothetical protein